SQQMVAAGLAAHLVGPGAHLLVMDGPGLPGRGGPSVDQAAMLVRGRCAKDVKYGALPDVWRRLQPRKLRMELDEALAQSRQLQGRATPLQQEAQADEVDGNRLRRSSLGRAGVLDHVGVDRQLVRRRISDVAVLAGQ